MPDGQLANELAVELAKPKVWFTEIGRRLGISMGKWAKADQILGEWFSLVYVG